MLDDFLGEASLKNGITKTQERACMPKGEFFAFKERLNLGGQLQNTEIIGDEGAIATDSLGDLFLREVQRFD